jgi:hypothetical protein
MFGLRRHRHRFGSGGRGGFGLGGRRAGLGDAGNEALGHHRGIDIPQDCYYMSVPVRVMLLIATCCMMTAGSI